MTNERFAFIRCRLDEINARNILHPEEVWLLRGWCTELAEELQRWRPRQGVLWAESA